MLIDSSDAPNPDAADGLIFDTDAVAFMSEVVDASKTVPVIVDFWAPWCRPCKQLGPLLEKLVRQYGGKVKLAKINVDNNQELAAQFQIQSIPAVYAFKDGRPADGFMGVLPEYQIKQFIDRLTGGGGSPLDEALAEADAFLAENNAEDALAVYQEVLAQDPEHIKAAAGVLKAQMALGQDEAARTLLAGLSDQLKKAPDIAGVQAALELKAASAGAGDQLQELEAKVAADPKDMQARLDLATARYGAGDRERAMDELLEMVRQDRAWNEQAARKQLVKFFEALGPTDPLTLQGRRRLSSILFS